MTRSERRFLKSLHQKKYRYRHQRTLVEGEKLLKEALNAAVPIETIYYSDHASKEIQSLLQSFAKSKFVFHADIEYISAHKNPEGVIATTVIPDTALPDTTTAFSTAIYLWHINDPGNLGTILRTAAWFGINPVFLSPGSVDPFSPKVIRGSMGTIFRNDVRTEVPFEYIRTMAAQCDIDLIAADTAGDPPDKLDTNRWLLIMGNESHGLPDFILNQSNFIVGIPRTGYGESLNLSVSAGILFHELHRIKRSC
jgi:TrmH family RNA methyltransferase